jgi:hypothetical protein
MSWRGYMQRVALQARGHRLNTASWPRAEGLLQFSAQSECHYGGPVSAAMLETSWRTLLHFLEPVVVAEIESVETHVLEEW